MEMNVRDDKKIVEIWLTNAEKNDPVLRESLKDVYAKYKAKKYLVAVFESGSGDLYQYTRDLLIYNRRRSAQRAVQQEKKQRSTSMERLQKGGRVTPSARDLFQYKLLSKHEESKLPTNCSQLKAQKEKEGTFL